MFAIRRTTPITTDELNLIEEEIKKWLDENSSDEEFNEYDWF